MKKINSPFNKFTKSKNQLSPIQTLLCGFAGVIVPRSIFAPLRLMKLEAQLSEGNFLPQFLNRTLTKGISSLWHGHYCQIIRIPSQILTRFLIYNNLQSIPYFHEKHQSCNHISEAIVSLAFHPIGVIQTLMAMYPDHYQSFSSTAGKLFQSEGVKGFYRGFGPVFYGVFPFHLAQAATISFFDSLFENRKFTKQQSKIIPIALNIGSILVGQTAIYPFDVVRNKMIIDNRFQNLSTSQVFKTIFQNRGIQGFFDGYGITMLRILPVALLQYVFTNETRKFLVQFNKHIRIYNDSKQPNHVS